MAVETPGVADDAIPPPPSAPPPLVVSEAAPTELAPVAPPPSPAPPPRSRGARRFIWYTAILVAVVVSLGGFGLLYLDDQSWQHRAGDLQQQNGALHDQLSTAQSDANDAQAQVKDLQAQAQHPTLGIWNVPQKIDGPDYWLEGGIPDTFTYHLKATATGPMSVSILTYDQYAAGVRCMQDGRGSAHYCMHHSGAVKSWLEVTSLNYDFHLAEGCAGYMAVWTAGTAITVMPDVSVTYNPAPTFTGAC